MTMTYPRMLQNPMFFARARARSGREDSVDRVAVWDTEQTRHSRTRYKGCARRRRHSMQDPRVMTLQLEALAHAPEPFERIESSRRGGLVRLDRAATLPRPPVRSFAGDWLTLVLA